MGVNFIRRSGSWFRPMSILIYFWDSSKVDFEEILSFWDLSVPNLFSPFSQKVFMMFCQAPKILFQRETIGKQATMVSTHIGLVYYPIQPRDNLSYITTYLYKGQSYHWRWFYILRLKAGTYDLRILKLIHKTLEL